MMETVLFAAMGVGLTGMITGALLLWRGLRRPKPHPIIQAASEAVEQIQNTTAAAVLIQRLMDDFLIQA